MAESLGDLGGNLQPIGWASWWLGAEPGVMGLAGTWEQAEVCCFSHPYAQHSVQPEPGSGRTPFLTERPGAARAPGVSRKCSPLCLLLCGLEGLGPACSAQPCHLTGHSCPLLYNRERSFFQWAQTGWEDGGWSSIPAGLTAATRPLCRHRLPPRWGLSPEPLWPVWLSLQGS